MALLFCLVACRGPEARVAEVPRPDLSAVEPAVAQQLTQAADRLLELRDRDANPEETAATWGELGRLYQAYDFAGEAMACYEEAALLSSGDPRWLYYQGVVAQTGGRWEVAVAKLEEALEGNPNDRPTRLRLAEVLVELGRLDRAEALYRSVFEGPSSAAAAAGLGRIALRHEDWPLAIEYFEGALAAQPEASVIRYPLAQAYRAVGRVQEADEQLALSGTTGVVFEDPLMHELESLAVGTARRLARAGAALTTGRPETALAEYRRAVEESPADSTARLNLGVLLALQGKPREAETHLRRAVALEPDRPSARLALARLLIDEGHYDEARLELAGAVALDPDSEAASFQLGRLEAATGDHRAAIEAFDEILRRNPQALAVRLARAISSLEIDRPVAAAQDLRQVLLAEPDHALARLRLGEALQRSGDVAGAREQFRHAATGDLPAKSRAVAWLSLGNLALQEGRREEARQALVAALAANPSLAAAHFNLAGLEVEKGDDESARWHYQQVVDLETDNLSARFHLALTRLRLGEREAAERLFGEILEADPAHEGAASGRAATLFALSRYEESLSVLTAGLRASPASRNLAHGLARFLASCPERSLRDGERAVEIALGLVAEQKTLDYAETLAMALAEAGRVEEAVEWQREVIRQAAGSWPEEQLRRLRENLARYERGESCCAGA